MSALLSVIGLVMCSPHQKYTSFHSFQVWECPELGADSSLVLDSLSFVLVSDDIHHMENSKVMKSPVVPLTRRRALLAATSRGHGHWALLSPYAYRLHSSSHGIKYVCVCTHHRVR